MQLVDYAFLLTPLGWYRVKVSNLEVTTKGHHIMIVNDQSNNVYLKERVSCNLMKKNA